MIAMPKCRSGNLESHMKRPRYRSWFLAVILLSLWGLMASPTAQINPTGTWKATFTGPIGDRPKPFGSVVFRLRVTDGHVTGTALMGNWPGEAPLTDVKF